MEYVDMFHQPYASFSPEPAHHHQPPHDNNNNSHAAHHQTYAPMWHNQLYLVHLQHQQRAAMMAQGSMPPSMKATDPKPRLAKDEVDLLEREFASNPKPTSSTKRELAEQMGVEVARINNWFQNRRAKAKGIKRTQEFNAQQARERAESGSKSPESQAQSTVTEFYELSNRHQPLGPSTASFSDDQDASSQDDGQTLLSEPEDADGDVVAEPGAPVREEDHKVAFKVEFACPPPAPADPIPVPQIAIPTVSHDFMAPQPVHPLPLVHEQHHVDQMAGQGLAIANLEAMANQQESVQHMAPFTQFVPALVEGGYLAPTVPSFPSQLLPGEIKPDMMQTAELMSTIESCDGSVKLEQMSPASMGSSPAPSAADLRFKSPPPPSDLAARRNIRRPAPLGLGSLRNASFGSGPKTGIDGPRRIDAPSPMRRIASASGTLSGRIQKSAGSGPPRSPFIMERNKEALMQSLQGSQSPVMCALNNAMSPLTPDHRRLPNHGMREATVSSTTSEEEHGYTFGGFSGPMLPGDHTIKTPPGTPGFFPQGFGDQGYVHSIDAAWGYVPHDDPLPTPSLGSHGSELDFSMAPPIPGYVATSQPVTPSFPPTMGPAYCGLYGNSGLANAEYTFPDSYPEASAQSSPGLAKSIQFQFTQNVTPQDFSTEK